MFSHRVRQLTYGGVSTYTDFDATSDNRLPGVLGLKVRPWTIGIRLKCCEISGSEPCGDALVAALTAHDWGNWSA